MGHEIDLIFINPKNGMKKGETMKNDRLYEFSGTIEECLLFLSEQTENQQKIVDTIFQFHPTTEKRTVRRWLNLQASPMGMHQIYLKFILFKFGLKVSEVEFLDPEIKKLGIVILDNLLDLSLIHEKLGIPQRSILEYLQGKILPSEERIQLLSDFCNTYLQPEERKPTTKAKEKAIDSDEITIKKNSIITVFIQSAEATQAMLEHILSDDFSREERRKVRDAFGRKKLFELSLLFDAMSSEESRKQLQMNNGDK